jgi:hypothetical protein
MQQIQVPFAEKACGTEEALQKIKPFMQRTSKPTHSAAMITTWLSTIGAGILTFFIWTDGCFFRIPVSIVTFLPGPLTMLAIFWLHIIPIVLVAKRDGERLRATRLL